MLVKPKKQDNAVSKPLSSSNRKRCVCNKCHKTVTYKEITIPIQYGFNCKQSVQIEGIERVCSECGWHVDDVEVSLLNHNIAMEVLQPEQ